MAISISTYDYSHIMAYISCDLCLYCNASSLPPPGNEGDEGEGGSIHVIVHIRQDTCPPLVVYNSAMMAIFSYTCTTTIGRKITNSFDTVVQKRGPSSVKGRFQFNS